MSQISKSFCVLLPILNEAEHIQELLHELSKFLGGFDIRTAIIAVDDGSTDRTPMLLEELSSQIPNLIIKTHTKNMGYGVANRTGISEAILQGYDYVIVMDADFTQRIYFITRFFPPMEEGVDFIKATRYSKGGGVVGLDFKRWVISWLGNKLARVVFRLPITDYTNGFRAISCKAIKNLNCSHTGFSYLIEEVREAKKIGVNFEEIPYTLTVRKKNISTSKFVYSLGVYRKYLGALFGM